MRILVADDEALVRFSLISVLEDILENPPTILEAANGRELVERAREARPHIGFVDIRMPLMDGLQAIAEARKYAPRTLWVIVSGHGDFNYAREALKLGVEDFLLKPVDPEEVTSLIGRLLEKAKERQRRGNRELQAKISAVLGDTSSPEFDSWFAKPRFWQASMVIWDWPVADGDNTVLRREYARRLQDTLDSGDDFSGCIVSWSGDALLIVLSMPTRGIPMDVVIDLWRRQLADLHETGRKTLDPGIGDTWFLTRVVQDPGELFREIAELASGSHLRFVHRPSEIMDYGDVAAHAGTSRNLALAAILVELRDNYLYGAEDDFHGLVHRLLEQLDHRDTTGETSGGSAWFSRYGIPVHPPVDTGIRDLAERLHDECHVLFTRRNVDDRRQPAGETLAAKALEVMNRRYRETIGISQVAEDLGVTANYLSTVFKKDIGMGFTRKLTELRLTRACELLMRPDANIREIAHSLGYQSSRHFGRLFKERYGTTPSQWIAATLSEQEHEGNRT